MNTLYLLFTFSYLTLSPKLLKAQNNDNVTIGNGAGYSLSTSSGFRNVMIGPNSGLYTTSGFVNVMIGPASGQSNTTGNYNTYIGNGAGQNNVVGNFNTCIGDGSGYRLTTSDNMMLGVHAGFNTSSGAKNVMIGNEAGVINESGSLNTLIGYGANVSTGNLTNATAIGSQAIASVSNSIILGNNANVGIGTSYPQYKLSVNGTIGAREIKVTANGWADFVFKPTYYLPKLATVEQYIKKHNHLPDVPSAAEITANGVSVGAMQAKLLQKIEELTLYVIKQQKRIEVIERKLRRK